MNRRDFLKTSSFWGSTLFFPGFDLTSPVSLVSEGIYSFQVGKFDCYSISDGIYPNATLKFLFDTAPEALVARQAQAYDLPATNIPIPLNYLLVRKGGKMVLIDTGYGPLANHWNYPAGKLLNTLKANHINLEKITAVVITHGHPDHLGGVTDEKGRMIFPNARFYLDQKEFAALTAQGGWAAEKLKAIESKIEIIEDGQKIITGITIDQAPGHTPGNIHLLIESKGEKLYYTSDTFGHELHLAFPDWSMGHEFSKEQAAAIRKEVLERAVEENLTLFSCHLPFPGMGKVQRSGQAYRWVPLA